jgi:hypothetical protein
MQKGIKKVMVATNFNNKYTCEHFIHIERIEGLPPIDYDALTANIVEWQFTDGSIDPVQSQCYDLHRLPAKYLMDWQSRLSHGISRNELKALLQVSENDQIGIFSYITLKN